MKHRSLKDFLLLIGLGLALVLPASAQPIVVEEKEKEPPTPTEEKKSEQPVDNLGGLVGTEENWQEYDASGWQKLMPCGEWCVYKKFPKEMQPGGTQYESLSPKMKELFNEFGDRIALTYDMNGNLAGATVPGKLGSHGGMSLLLDDSFQAAMKEMNDAKDKELSAVELAKKKAAEKAAKEKAEQKRREEAARIQSRLGDELADKYGPKMEDMGVFGDDGFVGPPAPEDLATMNRDEIVKELERQERENQEEKERQLAEDRKTNEGVTVKKTPATETGAPGEFKADKVSVPNEQMAASLEGFHGADPTLTPRPAGSESIAKSTTRMFNWLVDRIGAIGDAGRKAKDGQERQSVIIPVTINSGAMERARVFKDGGGFDGEGTPPAIERVEACPDGTGAFNQAQIKMDCRP